MRRVMFLAAFVVFFSVAVACGGREFAKLPAEVSADGWVAFYDPEVPHNLLLNAHWLPSGSSCAVVVGAREPDGQACTRNDDVRRSSWMRWDSGPRYDITVATGSVQTDFRRDFGRSLPSGDYRMSVAQPASCAYDPGRAPDDPSSSSWANYGRYASNIEAVHQLRQYLVLCNPDDLGRRVYSVRVRYDAATGAIAPAGNQ